MCDSFETVRELCCGIGVTHPAHALIAESLEEVGVIVEVDNGPSILLHMWTLDFPSERLDRNLKSVADPEHGNVKAENLFFALGCIWVVDACGAAREDYGSRCLGPNLTDSSVPRQELRIDFALSDPSGYEVGILSAEVQDYDGIVRLV